MTLPDPFASLVTEAEALYSPEKVDEAEAEYRNQLARVAEAEAQVREAEEQVEAAQIALDRLQERGRHGALATLAEIVEAQNRLRSAESACHFARGAVRIREGVRDAAAELVVEARAAAWRPTRDRGIELCIRAGAICDAARRERASMSAETTPFPVLAAAEDRQRAGFAEARPLWEAGRQIVRTALDNGARLPVGVRFIPDAWPTSEEAQRRHWRRPVEMPDAAD